MIRSSVLEKIKLFSWIFILGFFTLLSYDKVEVIENPKPTHFETKYVTLELKNSIDSEIDESQYFAQMVCLQVDSEVSIYGYDNILKKIFKFDKQFKLVKVFGNKGQGPGEYTGNDWGIKTIYLSSDDLLFVRAPFNRRIIIFDKSGTHLDDIRIAPEIGVLSCPVVVDETKNFYILSFHDGALDVYDKEMSFSCTLLDRKEYEQFIFYRPMKSNSFTQVTFTEPAIFNTYYDILGEGKFVIYLANSSQIFILKDNKVLNKFYVWPEKAMQSFKRMLVEKLKIKGGVSTHFTSFAYNLIVDKDDPRYFYLAFYPEGHLYKFDLSGKLIHVLKVNGKTCEFQVKRNNLFFGLTARGQKIQVYKTKENNR